MCDTIFASAQSTAERIALFGKNSDRERNEAQTVEHFSVATHGADAKLKCTYITIPQVRRTNAVLLCRPFWCWGAEMGANEHGVVIGNEGLHARTSAPEAEALVGMDLVRLALERAATAAEAVDVITTLLEQYGQGGDCGHLMQVYYNNGFLLADAAEAFVLESVGREWVLERVARVRTLSNTYSIGRDAQRVSAGLLTMIANGGWSLHAHPHYGDAISNPGREHIGRARARLARSSALLNSRLGSLGAGDMMNVLRDHDAGGASSEGAHFANVTICMHAAGEDRPGQTTGSLVSELRGAGSIHWVTGSAAPCTSIFKPVLLDAPFPAQGLLPTDRFDPQTLWWSHERLHRTAILAGLQTFLEDIRCERDQLEAAFRTQVQEVVEGGTAADRARVVLHCWAEASAAEDRWLRRAREMPWTMQETAIGKMWLDMSLAAGMDLSP